MNNARIGKCAWTRANAHEMLRKSRFLKSHNVWNNIICYYVYVTSPDFGKNNEYAAWRTNSYTFYYFILFNNDDLSHDDVLWYDMLFDINYVQNIQILTASSFRWINQSCSNSSRVQTIPKLYNILFFVCLNIKAGQCRSIPWQAVPDWPWCQTAEAELLMPDCWCRLPMPDCQCWTANAGLNLCRVYSSTASAEWSKCEGAGRGGQKQDLIPSIQIFDFYPTGCIPYLPEFRSHFRLYIVLSVSKKFLTNMFT
jgi:hypothetical protein